MAMHDWNGNGENDWGDNYIEYKIYEDFTKNNNSNGSSGGGDGSCLMTIITMFIGFVIAGGILAMMGGAENVPTIVVCIVTIPVLAIVAAVVSEIFK
mgnify:CR=1 FL=1